MSRPSSAHVADAVKPSPARAEPHDATAWLPLPEVKALPSLGDLLVPDPDVAPSAPRDVPVGLPSPARSEPHDATTWLPLPDLDELPAIDDLLVPDPDVLPVAPREVPVAVPSPARAEPHDATAWLPIPDLTEAEPEAPEAASAPRRHHRRPRLRVHLPWRSIAMALIVTLVLGGGYFGVERLLDQPDFTLRVDGRRIVAESGAANVRALLAEQGITMAEHDEVVPPGSTPVRDKMRVEVRRGFPVVVNFDGVARTVYTTRRDPDLFLDDVGSALNLPPEIDVRDRPKRIVEDTVVQVRTRKTGTLILDGQFVAFDAPVFQVQELLDDYDVVLGPLDQTKPGRDEAVPDDGTVEVIRAAQMTAFEDVSYTLPTRRLPDPNAPVEVTDRVEPGRAGVLRITYALDIENGKEVGRKAISKIPTIPAVPTIIYYGTRYDARWDKMAECETGGNWDASGFKYQGGLGIYYRNWSHYGGKKFAPTAGQATKYEQIIVAERIKDEHGWGAWGCNKQLHFSG